MDLTESIAPKSDQLNADDLMAQTFTVTIESVSKGSSEQPVDVHLTEFPGRPFRPSKSMRRVMVTAWGKDSTAYVGQRMTLYRDPDITFGRDKVGGIRISHMTGIDKRLSIALTVTRGKRAPYVVEPLANTAPTSAVQANPVDVLVNAFDALGVTATQLESWLALPVAEWTDKSLASLRTLGGEIQRGEKIVADEFAEVQS